MGMYGGAVFSVYEGSMLKIGQGYVRLTCAECLCASVCYVRICC